MTRGRGHQPARPSDDGPGGAHHVLLHLLRHVPLPHPRGARGRRAGQRLRGEGRRHLHLGKEAFNPHLGLHLSWIQNVVWYPHRAGISPAASIAYTIGLPALAQNSPFVWTLLVAMYWFAVMGRRVNHLGHHQPGLSRRAVLPGHRHRLAAAAWLAGHGIEFHIPRPSRRWSIWMRHTTPIRGSFPTSPA